MLKLFLEGIGAAISGLGGGTNATISFCICLFILFLSFFLAHTLIGLRSKGYSQPAIAMSCGPEGGVAPCGKLVIGILKHMQNLTWDTFVLHCSNGKCVYVCVSV